MTQISTKPCLSLKGASDNLEIKTATFVFRSLELLIKSSETVHKGVILFLSSVIDRLLNVVEMRFSFNKVRYIVFSGGNFSFSKPKSILFQLEINAFQ